MIDDTTLAVIRKTRTAPTLWSLSPIWPVPKHNGKQGLQGKRPANGVHCFSRAFMRLSYKRPVPSPYVYGCVAGRRREEAVGAALNIQARCIRAGKSYMFKLRDVRGAFTNVTHKSVVQHLEETQKAPEAVHHNQHVNTILRTHGGGDWKITKGTRQGDFGCDIFLGVYDIPLKKYVSSRQPTNDVMKLEGQKIDVSLLAFIDDLMDILIEGTPGAMKLRDATNDKKNSQKKSKKSDVSRDQAKRSVSSSGWGLTPERTWPNVVQELCLGRAASPKQSGILDVGLKWEEERAQ